MPNDFEPSKLNAAVQVCVRRCRNSNAPLALLAAFRDQLAADPDWGHEEIAAVERRVVALIRNLVAVE